MKKAFITLLLVCLISTPAQAAQRIRCTCYLPTGNRTYSGLYPCEGMIAADKAHIGRTAALYTEDMELIGYFECKDTGGDAIQSGSRIDVYRDNEESLTEWVNNYGDYVFIEWIGGKK